MVEAAYEVRECDEPSCRFRFPAAMGSKGAPACPRCGAPTHFDTQYSRGSRQEGVGLSPDDRTVVALLDNIRSAYNVGAMFRTADGAGLSHLYLCGMTPTPEHRKVAKTALGAQNVVPWSYHLNGRLAALALKEAGYCLWALEDSPGARWLFASPGPREFSLALVVGNERAGVDPGILAVSDQILRLPMLGGKESLNVEVAFGIAAYWVRFALNPVQGLAGRA